MSIPPSLPPKPFSPHQSQNQNQQQQGRVAGAAGAGAATGAAPLPSLGGPEASPQNNSNAGAVGASIGGGSMSSDQPQWQQPGIIDPTPLSRSLMLLPAHKLAEFQNSADLLKGYLVSLLQVKTIQKNQRALAEQQLNRLANVLGEFAKLNDYGAGLPAAEAGSDETSGPDDSGAGDTAQKAGNGPNIKVDINARLSRLKQLELEYKQQEKQMFAALRPLQLQYKDNGILWNKLQDGISEQEKISTGLFESIMEVASVDNSSGSGNSSSNNNNTNNDNKSDSSNYCSNEDIETFIREYKESRRKYHWRREALKRMSEDRIAGVI